jgi:hypothetical protein
MLMTQKRPNRQADAAMDPLDSLSTLDDMHAAIRAILFDSPERLDIRHLWTRGAISYFRVNRWSPASTGSPRIVRSSFVLVEGLDSGWRVQERSRPQRGGALPAATRARHAA